MVLFSAVLPASPSLEPLLLRWEAPAWLGSEGDERRQPTILFGFSSRRLPQLTSCPVILNFPIFAGRAV